MTSQQIKTYISLKQVDQITRFENVSDEQVVKTFHFTEKLTHIGGRLLASAASGRGSYALVGDRGMGKSHLLHLVRSTANLPRLIQHLETPETISVFEKMALPKLPADGLPTLMIGFDPDRKLSTIKTYPKIPGFGSDIVTSELLSSMGNLDDIIEQRLKSADQTALLIDGICYLLKDPEQGAIMLEWLQALAEEANRGSFSLIISLDRDIAEGPLATKLRNLFYYEEIESSSIAEILDNKIFRKTPQQRRNIEDLYTDLRARMPYFSGTLAKFVQLYPLHPIVLELAPTIRDYARTFSLLSFITAVSTRAMVRRGLNLICLDDLFESFEFDLRKHPDLAEAFSIYDHLFTKVIPTMGQPHGLYAKMMLKGLLLLSLTGRAATAQELADVVMIYDDREPANFTQQISIIMTQILAKSSGIILDSRGGQHRYKMPINSPTAGILPQKTGEMPIPSELPKPTTKPLAKLATSPLAAVTTAALPNLGTNKEDAFSELPYAKKLLNLARNITDDDIRLDYMLIAVGKKHFRDWPLNFDLSTPFRERTELNIKWRGSLRKGIINFGNSGEIYRNIDDNQPIYEYDWQVTILRSYQILPTLPPLTDPVTLLYWHPLSLTALDRATLKCLLALNIEGVGLFEAEATYNQTKLDLEYKIADIFYHAYIQEGYLINNQQNKISLQPSTFFTTSLTKLLDNVLAERYPQHPTFEDLLDPEYINEMINWMFAPNSTPTPDQQMYLEQFARPLQLISVENGTYKLTLKDRAFAPNTPVGELYQYIQKSTESISKLAAYQVVRREPFGLQRPVLLLILAALAADGCIVLTDESGEPIHNEAGMRPDIEIGDFTSINRPDQIFQQISWQSTQRSAEAEALNPENSLPDFTGESNPEIAIDYQYKLLIVDDDNAIHMVLKLAAQTLGCKLEHAYDGVEALDKLQSGAIDLVISDLRMPNMSGVELFQNMQANPQLRDIPFVVLSSIDGDEQVAAALESGVEDYWIKPFRVNEIRARIKKLIMRNLTTTGAYAAATWTKDIELGAKSAPSPKPIKTPLSLPVPPPIPAPLSSPLQPTSTKENTPLKGDTTLATNKKSEAKAASMSGSMPAIPHPPIPQPLQTTNIGNEKTPVSPQKSGANPTLLEDITNNSATPKFSTKRNDGLVIPSITKENLIPSETPKFEIKAENEDAAKELEKQEFKRNFSTVYCMTLSDPEAIPIEIMHLYNQFWDTCRKVGKPTSIPEYEEFKEMVTTKAKKLKRQFHWDELVFTVNIEDEMAHVDCQVNRTSNFLKTPPKFRLL